MDRFSSLAGKRVFLTGATGGIGSEIARQLVKYGAHLFISSRREDSLTELRESLVGLNSDVDIHCGTVDLSNLESVALLAEKALEKFETIDVLINCAGVFTVKPFLLSDLADFDLNITTNLQAPFFLAKKFVPGMKRQAWGRIVSVGSSSCYGGAPNTSLYCMVKHGVLGLTRALNAELKEFGIRAQCISPAGTKTEMGRAIEGQTFDYFLDPVEVAEFITFAMTFDNEMMLDEVRLNRVRLG